MTPCHHLTLTAEANVVSMDLSVDGYIEGPGREDGLAEEVARLERETSNYLLSFGGAELASTLQQHGASAITGHATNGWWFFLVRQSPRRSLRDVWRDYVDGLAVDAADEDTERRRG